MNLGNLNSKKKHKIKGEQYLTIMMIADATKNVRSFKIPKWLRFPVLVLAVILVWKSLTFYEYVVRLEATVAETQLVAQEATIVSESKDTTIVDLQVDLSQTKENRYEQLLEVQELAMQVGLQLEDFKEYRETMEEYKDEIDAQLGNTEDVAPQPKEETVVVEASEILTLDFDVDSMQLAFDPNEEYGLLLTSAAIGSVMNVSDQGDIDSFSQQNYDTVNFDAEITKLSDYFNSVLNQINSNVVEYEETNAALEEIIPYVESYPSVLPIENTYITSPFGYRSNPFGYKSSEFHSGVDLKATYEEVAATGAGTVIVSEYLSGYGYTIVIDHGYGITTKYAHNSKLYVSVGDKVVRGDIISKSGNTGRSTGPHLHYEVLLDGEPQNPLDYIYEEGSN